MNLSLRGSDYERLIKETIVDPEIVKGIQSSGITSEWLSQQLVYMLPRVKEAIATEVAEIESLKVRMQEIEDLKPSSALGRAMNRFSFFLTYAIACALAFVVYQVVIRFDLLPSYFLNMVGGRGQASFGIIVLIGFCSSIFYHRSAHRRRFAALGFNQLKYQAESIFEDMNHRLLPDFMRQEARAIISRNSSPNFALDSKIERARGLAEIYNPIYDIPTASLRLIENLLGAMPGGSIGISGARGAGKSTVLRSFCDPARESVGGRKTFGVLTTAPVQYDPREYILYLFSAVCRRVLGLQPEPGIEDKSAEDWRRFSTRERRPRIARLLPFGGIMMVFTALMLAALIVGTGNSNSNELLLASVDSTSGKDQGSRDNADGANVNAISSAPDGTSPRISRVGEFLKMAELLGVTPANLLLLGVIICVVGSLAGRFLPTDNQLRDRARHDDYDYYWGDSEIQQLARRWLHELRFQQSYSSGWSGSLKIPIGESGRSISRNVSLKQMSLPEVTAGFTHFLRQIVKSGNTVLLGIDEMDKIGSDDQACQFLNELKALFGVEGVFFFVSVSESAMSTFERRGLAFRNAFDSAFDSVIYIDSLEFSDAQALLARRVIGLPVPHAALCYAISGGVPRDLIRACRTLISHAQTLSENHLVALSRSILHVELSAKRRALMVEAQSISKSDLRSRLLSSIVENLPENAPYEWMRNAEDISRIWRVAACDKVREICAEVCIYTYFCATVVEFLDSLSDKTETVTAATFESFTLLAEAQRTFVFDLDLAAVIIDRFRNAHGLGGAAWNPSKPSFAAVGV